MCLACEGSPVSCSCPSCACQGRQSMSTFSFTDFWQEMHFQQHVVNSNNMCPISVRTMNSHGSVSTAPRMVFRYECATVLCHRWAANGHSCCCSKCNWVNPQEHTRRCNDAHPEIMASIRACRSLGCQMLVTGRFQYCCSGCRTGAHVHSSRCFARSEALRNRRNVQQSVGQGQPSVGQGQRISLDEMD